MALAIDEIFDEVAVKQPAQTRPSRAFDPLGHNAVGAEPASVRELGRAILGNVLKRDKPPYPSTTASPSIVKLLALIRSAAAAIAENLAVKSIALRL